MRGAGARDGDGYNNVRQAVTLAGLVPNTIRLRSATQSGQDQAALALVTQGGGDVLGVVGSPFGGYDTPIFKNYVVGIMTSSASCLGSDRLLYKGFPHVGFRGPHNDYGALFTYCNAAALVETVFNMQEQLQLKVEVEGGGGSARCAGYITMSWGSKFYNPGAEVTLTANALPGYTFLGWRSGSNHEAWLGVGADHYAGSPVPVDGETESEIHIRVGTHSGENVYDNCGTHTYTAVFRMVAAMLIVYVEDPSPSSPMPHDGPLDNTPGHTFWKFESELGNCLIPEELQPYLNKKWGFYPLDMKDTFVGAPTPLPPPARTVYFQNTPGVLSPDTYHAYTHYGEYPVSYAGLLNGLQLTAELHQPSEALIYHVEDNNCTGVAIDVAQAAGVTLPSATFGCADLGHIFWGPSPGHLGEKMPFQGSRNE